MWKYKPKVIESQTKLYMIHKFGIWNLDRPLIIKESIDDILLYMKKKSYTYSSINDTFIYFYRGLIQFNPTYLTKMKSKIKIQLTKTNFFWKPKVDMQSQTINLLLNTNLKKITYRISISTINFNHCLSN